MKTQCHLPVRLSGMKYKDAIREINDTVDIAILDRADEDSISLELGIEYDVLTSDLCYLRDATEAERKTREWEEERIKDNRRRRYEQLKKEFDPS